MKGAQDEKISLWILLQPFELDCEFGFAMETANWSEGEQNFIKGIIKFRDFTLMLDESSMITNPTAKRTKFVHALEPENVILLSGTPTGGKYEKLWSQLKLLVQAQCGRWTDTSYTENAKRPGR